GGGGGEGGGGGWGWRGVCWGGGGGGGWGGVHACGEGLDDDHTPAAARAGTGQLALIIGACFFVGLFDEDWWNAQELAKASDVRGPVAVGKQSIVADAVGPPWEDMQKEGANELMGVECHCLPAIGAMEAIVFPSEGDATVVGGDQPPVGNGDAMGVARQVAEHGFRPSEWLLGVNDPLDFAQRRKEGGEGSPIGERRVISEELQAVGLMRLHQDLQKHASEKAREHADRHDKARPARDPA